jgi:hypothetical protein
VLLLQEWNHLRQRIIKSWLSVATGKKCQTRMSIS